MRELRLSTAASASARELRIVDEVPPPLTLALTLDPTQAAAAKADPRQKPSLNPGPLPPRGLPPSSVPTQVPQLVFSLQLAGLGVSLIDQEPREILHAALQDVELAGAKSDTEVSPRAEHPMYPGRRPRRAQAATRRAQAATLRTQVSLELSIANLQIDSTIADTRFPVLLSAAPSAAAAEPEADEPRHVALRLSYTQNLRWTALVYVEELGVVLQPLLLQLEQNVAARLLRLLHGALEAVDEAAASLEALVALEGGGDGSGGDDDDDGTAGAAGADAAAQEDGTPAGDAPAAGEAEEGTQAPLEIFLRELRLHPVSLTIELQMEAICAEAELQEFHPTRQVLGLAQQLVSQPLLSRIELNCLILEDASFESFDSLALRVGSHYFYQGLHSVYRLAVNRIGSLDELGNLSSAFSGISGGIQQLYYEPRQGLVQSPRAFARGTLKGVGGLAGGVVGGTGIAFFSFASAMGKHAGTLASAISMDSEWKHHQRAQQQRHAQSTRGGLLMGAQSLGQGLLEGGKGVFVKPVAGAMDDGARGFVKGLGTGLIGLIAKPTSGLAGAMAKTAEGLASDAKHLTSGRARTQLRVRQPRVIGPDSVLHPYPRTPPLGPGTPPPDDEADEAAAGSSSGQRVEGGAG